MRDVSNDRSRDVHIRRYILYISRRVSSFHELDRDRRVGGIGEGKKEDVSLIRQRMDHRR